MYLTIDEAAAYASQQKGFAVEPSVLVRAGIAGALVIRATFPRKPMHNAHQGGDEVHDGDFLVIPPKHLLELEGEGAMRVQVAFNSRNEVLFPYCDREEKHLRFLITELDQFLPRLVSTVPTAHVPDATIAMKRSVLVDRHKQQWPTIESDLSAASENGLNVARRGERGWDEALALKWAEAKGKLAKPNALAQTMSSLPGRRHVLR